MLNDRRKQVIFAMEMPTQCSSCYTSLCSYVFQGCRRDAGACENTHSGLENRQASVMSWGLIEKPSIHQLCAEFFFPSCKMIIEAWPRKLCGLDNLFYGNFIK